MSDSGGYDLMKILNCKEVMGMHYAVSDIHGCGDKYYKLLEKLNLQKDDMLFVLGDTLDRGKDGIEIIMDIQKRNNILHLCGNHEMTAYNILYKMKSWRYWCPMPSESVKNWLKDGGHVTLGKFFELKEEEQWELLRYINLMPVARTIKIGEQDFLLAHTVADKQKFTRRYQYAYLNYIYGEPEYEKVYDPTQIIVTGHTPTWLIDENYRGRIWRGNNHIAIDCGAVFGNPLGCICLETMEEIYVE